VKNDESSRSPLRVLAADDDPAVLELAKIAASSLEAVQLRCAASAAETFAALEAEAFDLVFLDLNLGDRWGSSLISDVLAASRDALVTVVTADERPATIVECMKRGAFDYVSKPISASRLTTIMGHVRSIVELKREVRLLGGEAEGASRNPAFSRIVTRSPLMFGLFRTVERIARSPLAVLVAGESGVGKELVSRAIHDLSRREGAFIPVNMAGLDDTLFADTLFGHVKGAYTGAEGKRRGLVREADGGTLFLDEIGDIGAEAQVKLLRFLQDGEFYPLGADKSEKSSARLVMATNADLYAKVQEGKFRADLYYRLVIHYIAVPPLRERREDIPLLVEKFAADAAEAFGRPVPRRIDGFLAAIEGWTFPGNVRELFALVHRAMSLAEGGTLPAGYALEYIRSQKTTTLERPFRGENAEDGSFPTLEEVMDRHIHRALLRSGGNQSLAAQLLGISQSTVSRKIAKNA
jgi:DNA-binding NtrC family response regulator